MIALALGVLLFGAPSTVEQANGLLRAGDAPAAHRVLHAHLQEHPGDAAAWTALGSALLMQKRIAEAADAYARARALDPSAGAAIFGEAEARLALGQSDDAAALYQAYLTAQNGRTEALDQAASARLAGLVGASKGGAPSGRTADYRGALPSQLLWGSAGGFAGAMLGSIGAVVVLFVGFEVLDDDQSAEFNLGALQVVTILSAMTVGFGGYLGGVAYGVRHAGRNHRIHGSLWRGMLGAAAGGVAGGLVMGAFGGEAFGLLFVPLGAALGAAIANNQVLVAPSEDRAEFLPARRKGVPSVLVLPAR